MPLIDVADQETILARADSTAKHEPRAAPIRSSPAPLPHPDPAEPSPATRRARKAVARAWARVLDRRSLRADLTFDEAGGDSLLLLKLIFDLEVRCRIALPRPAGLHDDRLGPLRPVCTVGYEPKQRRGGRATGPVDLERKLSTRHARLPGEDHWMNPNGTVAYPTGRLVRLSPLGFRRPAADSSAS